MRKSTEDVRDEEAAKLAEVLCSDSSANNVRVGCVHIFSLSLYGVCVGGREFAEGEGVLCRGLLAVLWVGVRALSQPPTQCLHYLNTFAYNTSYCMFQKATASSSISLRSRVDP